jgi:hypothetical protein
LALGMDLPPWKSGAMGHLGAGCAQDNHRSRGLIGA